MDVGFRAPPAGGCRRESTTAAGPRPEGYNAGVERRSRIVALAGCGGVVFALAIAGRLSAAPEAAAPPPPPSILLVTVDTLRADRVGAWGSRSGATPVLDRLAASGIRFDEARSHVPLTLPSHGTILTGRLPPSTTLRGNGPFRLAPGVPTLAEVLRGAGYRTGAVVASIVLDRATGLDRGFDAYDDEQRMGPRSWFDWIERGASQVASRAAGWLGRGGDGPFFLWVHFYDPHTPWVAPPKFRDRFPDGYDAEIAFADEALGQVLEAARQRAGGNLVVAVLSDHGESLGEQGENQHGYTLHRGVMRVPLVLAGAGIPAAAVIPDTVGLVDLAPTLAALAGASIPGAEGRDLARFWSERPQGAPRPGTSADTGLWEETLHPLFDSGWAPLRGLVTRDWHFVEAPTPRLWDRRRDPGDRSDVATKRKEIVAGLAKKTRETAEAIGDIGETTASADVDPERLAKLASLGYLSGAASAPRKEPRLDPKDGLPGFLAVEKAGELLRSGRPKEAIALLEPFVKKDPSNPRLWHQLGRGQADAGDLERAERSLRKSVALDPSAEHVRRALASVLEARGNVDGAKGELEAVLAANPRSADAALALSAMAVKRGDLAASEAILQRALAAGVRDPDLLGRIGLHRAKAGDAAGAETHFRQAVELDPDDPTGRLELARIEMRRGRPESARPHLDRCVDGSRAFECRMELARSFLSPPADLPSVRRWLLSAREAATDDRQRREVDGRLAQLPPDPSSGVPPR